MDAIQLGSTFRAVRIRLGLLQSEVAKRAGTSQSVVSEVEHGRLDRVSVATLLRIAEALEIRINYRLTWRGGELPRTLNAGHAAMHESAAQMLGRLPGRTFAPEVSFAIYGERGVIDILAFHPASRSLLVIELKTDLVDINNLMSAVDRYRRLAARVARERGWWAASVSAWVLLRDTQTNRRRMREHATVLRAAFPHDAHDLRRWLKQPGKSVAGLSFLAD